MITHRPSGASAEANERRSQADNLTAAFFRLRVRLALVVRGRQAETDSHSPSDLWRGRLRGRRLVINPSHEDFPSLLAEALDVLAATDWDDRAAAERLHISRTQLVRFLQLEPVALEQLNSHRRQQCLPPLR